MAFLVVGPDFARAQGELEEIIVTAEKREQSLQDVAAAVTAFTDTYIAEAGIVNAKDIAAHIPGMHLAVFSRMQALPTLRGAQSGEDSPGLDQPVAMFVDGVYKGRVTDWDLALFDVERIEVLRGPQGTLFGRNVVGGLINVITKKPTDTTRVVVEAGGGNLNLVDLKGVVSAPVSEGAGLFGSITFSTRTRDGYTFNPVSGNYLDSIDKQAAKGQLRFTPSDSYEMLWQADVLRDTGFGQHRDYIGAAPESPEFGGFVPDDDPSVSHQASDGGIDRTAWGTSLEIDWSTPLGEVKSISAYFEDEAKLPATDGMGSPLPGLFVETQEYELNQFSQELRLHGDDSINGRLDWVLGLYYLNIDHARDRSFSHDFAEGTFLGDLQLDIFGNTDPQFLQSFQAVRTDSISGFFQGTYSVTDAFRLTLGGRYTRDKKDGVVRHAGSSFIFSTGEDFSLPLSATFSKFTPRATVELDVSEDVMVYATYSEGFKSGGFIQFGLDRPQDHQVPLNPETAKNTEIGLRSAWLRNRLTANLTAYSVDYTDLQVSQLLPDGTFLQTNAGRAEADGIDLELNAAITQNLTAWLNYSYFDGTYTYFPGFTGNKMVAPENAYTAGISWFVELNSGNELRFRLDMQHKDEYFQDPDNSPGIMNGLDNIMNASVNWTIGPNWQLTVWGKNLRDERAFNYLNDSSVFMLSAQQLAAGLTSRAANYIEPRTWGLSAQYSFE